MKGSSSLKRFPPKILHILQNETPQNITPAQDETPVRGKTTMPLAQEENLPDLDKLLANDTNRKYENHKGRFNIHIIT